MKASIIGFWRQTKKVLQGFCHLLSITKSLILSAICHLESGIVVINGRLNVNAIIYIRLPKALLWLQLPCKGKKGELPCGINSLRHLSMLKGKILQTDITALIN